MSAEVVALLVLAGGAVAMVAFTLLIVAVVDPSGTDRRPSHGNGADLEHNDEEG